MKVIYFILLLFFILSPVQSQPLQFTNDQRDGDFSLFQRQEVPDIIIDREDHDVVKISAELLANDIKRVTGQLPAIKNSVKQVSANIIIIGSIDKSHWINELINSKKVNVDSIADKWETTLIKTIENPFPKVESALVIAGSDRRGTAYGGIELSRQIGVSPWVWWADVPTKKNDQVIIKSGTYYYGPPAVKYRGFFLNEDLWGLQEWAALTQDTAYKAMGPQAYQKVFELMLRLKANYLWPSRYSPFNEIHENAELADQYAIVRGSAHNGPLLSNARHIEGEWSYVKNPEKVRDVWKRNLENFGKYENVYTLGMRGSGDFALEEGKDLDEKVALLKRIIKDQRELLSSYSNKKITDIPQIFVPYKEVMEFYDHGLNLPEDITIIWPDDNYGYMKKLSNLKEQNRSGGSGVYFHLGYVGRYHTYAWLGTTPPALTWEELKKAYEFKARNLWVVNAANIKPLEYELDFFMDLAWKADQFKVSDINSHMINWYSDIFGSEIGIKAANIKQKFYHLAFPRKPEYMGWSPELGISAIFDTEFSFINYQEAELRLKAYDALQKDVDLMYQNIPESYKSAFYQLVYFPVSGSSLINKKFLIAQKNRWYARQGRSLTNDLAKKVSIYHDSIQILNKKYENINNKKWNGIIYDFPFSTFNKMPPIDSIVLPDKPDWNIWTEGNQQDQLNNAMPVFNSLVKPTGFFEIYNKSCTPFYWQAEVSDPWIVLSKTNGKIQDQERINVNIDWKAIDDENEKQAGIITIKVADTSKSLTVEFINPNSNENLSGLFAEDNGVIAIPAEKYHQKINKPGYHWEVLDGIGLTGKLISTFPIEFNPQTRQWKVAENAPYLPSKYAREVAKNAPSLNYDFYTSQRGWFEIQTYTLPTHPINDYWGVLYGISIDDQPPVIVDFSTNNYCIAEWVQNISRNSAKSITKHFIDKPGKHTLKIWQVQKGVWYDKFILDFGGLKKSYLGPEHTLIEDE